MKKNARLANLIAMVTLVIIGGFSMETGEPLRINEKEYFQKHGLNVMVLNDIYPEGHQGGIALIQHGKRVTNNGNLTLQPTPGQWQPFPHLIEKNVDRENNRITAKLMFPDSNRIKTHEQPVIYPDLELVYQLTVEADDEDVLITVHLEEPLPEDWVGKVAFMMELYPPYYFGKSYHIGDDFGVFPHYANSPVYQDEDGEFEAEPMARGSRLTVAPEDPEYSLTFISDEVPLELIDGRVKHNNGWFVIRSLLPGDKTKDALKWRIKAKELKDWRYGPVIHTSQLGYHPAQEKIAVLELDRKIQERGAVYVVKIDEMTNDTVLKVEPKKTDDFLRFQYFQADFTDLREPGIYRVEYLGEKSEIFKISENIYKKEVWQPTLEYFLPVQMCHMKVFEKYRVWHDLCHLDDALLAPGDINHFDVYTHGELPEGFKAFQHIKGLNKGGWHDAGDYDFRIESQLGTILTLVYAYEEFGVDHDQTLISQEDQIVEIHHPDGKADVLQQIEHGLLTVLGGYEAFGRLYRGILCPTLRQYALLGESGDMTDNEVFQGQVKGEYKGFWYNHIKNKYEKYFTPQYNRPVKKEYVEKLDDRFVFLEDNPGRQLYGACGLAAASRAMKEYDPQLAERCLDVAEALWRKFNGKKGHNVENREVEALTELYLTTGKDEYKDELLKRKKHILKNIHAVGWILGRAVEKMDDKEFSAELTEAMKEMKKYVDRASNENPFGIPYHPNIWGAGWGIQSFGYRHYFLHRSWPEIFSVGPMLNALNFVLGCHPGENTASFVSNVGTKSQLIAYGLNRADWSFIPGGVCSGTNIVRPDLPEMKNWPFLWQQTEYVMGGGATRFMFLVLAADKVLSR